MLLLHSIDVWQFAVLYVVLHCVVCEHWLMVQTDLQDCQRCYTNLLFLPIKHIICLRKLEYIWLLHVFKHLFYIIKLEMWANAQRDGRPAEYRWRPHFNAAVWLCSNAAKT